MFTFDGPPGAAEGAATPPVELSQLFFGASTFLTGAGAAGDGAPPACAAACSSAAWASSNSSARAPAAAISQMTTAAVTKLNSRDARFLGPMLGGISPHQVPAG